MNIDWKDILEAVPEIGRRVREAGREYGYPECCIEAFVMMAGVKDASDERRRAGEHTGFIPCQAHALEVLAGKPLASLILPTRTVNKPFPRGHL